MTIHRLLLWSPKAQTVYRAMFAVRNLSSEDIGAENHYYVAVRHHSFG